jgi:hypothetical protein
MCTFVCAVFSLWIDYVLGQLHSYLRSAVSHSTRQVLFVSSVFCVLINVFVPMTVCITEVRAWLILQKVGTAVPLLIQTGQLHRERREITFC